MISVIIVAYNEAEWIHSIISELEKQNHPDFEILLADGGSTDETVSLAKQRGVQTVTCRRGKSSQMNDASKKVTGNVLFFVHADMTFPKNTLLTIKEHIDKGFDGGGFSNVFDEHNKKIKRIGNWMNLRFFDRREQSDKGIFYGDNGIFVKKEVFEQLNGFKEVPIMEDYDFSNRMRKKYNVVKIKKPVITVSARRHAKSGFWKTRFQWVMIRILYKWGVSPSFLANWYSNVR